MKNKVIPNISHKVHDAQNKSTFGFSDIGKFEIEKVVECKVIKCEIQNFFTNKETIKFFSNKIFYDV